VFGALLHGSNDLSYWYKQLDKLEKTLPEEIQERLKISYDALNIEEKQIFLDIACFFMGENRDTAISIWNGSDWEGWLGLQTLQNKCLVEVDGWNIHMHDHLRDLGRSESHVTRPLRFWQPLRFWHIDELLEQSSVITVRGIRMVLSEDHDDDDFEGIQMRKLQLVDTEGSLLKRILMRVKSPNLIWLCWKKCPYSSLPPWISMKNLKVLEVSGDTLETLWQHESQAPLQLPLCLEELRVDGCVQLKSILGLAQLTKLHRLDVSGCSELKELPSMETLVCLEELRAGRCVKLKCIRGLEQGTKLQRLDVGGCSELDELPRMVRWESLEKLVGGGCVKV
jgi:hypothetical protein